MASQVPTEAPPRVAGKTYWDKGWQKCKEQPFVPLGALATCVALIGASQQFRTGNRQAFNRFLRFRVVAQGVTVVACVVGSAAWAKESAAQKAIAREEELEKIRVAGTRPVAVPAAAATADSVTKPQIPSPTPTRSQPDTQDAPSATTEELWRKWGVKSGSKT